MKVMYNTHKILLCNKLYSGNEFHFNTASVVRHYFLKPVTNKKIVILNFHNLSHVIELPPTTNKARSHKLYLGTEMRCVTNLCLFFTGKVWLLMLLLAATGTEV